MAQPAIFNKKTEDRSQETSWESNVRRGMNPHFYLLLPPVSCLLFQLLKSQQLLRVSCRA